MGVVPRHRWEYDVDLKSSWKKPRLGDFTDKDWDELSASEKRDIAAHFAWAPELPPENFTDLKLPHHDPKTHNVVWSGVRAAMAALLGARGGVNIPKEDKKKVYNHLAKHYKECGKEPPEFHYGFVDIETSYTLEKQGETLIVEGTLLYPGTFTPLQGIPITFTDDDIINIVENTEMNIPLYLTHYSNEPIGYITKLWIDYKDVDDNDKEEPVVKFRGYVFKEHEHILDGMYKVSMEYDVLEDCITGVAFVNRPAVPEAKSEKIEVVAMEDGSMSENVDVKTVTENTTDVEIVDTTTMSFDEFLRHKGLSEEDVKVAFEKAKKEVFAKLGFSEADFEEFEEYKKWKEDQLNKLIDEVKSLGFSNVDNLLKFAKSDSEKIELLKTLKENLALGVVDAVTTEVEIVDEKSVSEVEMYKALCERFGLPFEALKDRLLGKK